MGTLKQSGQATDAIIQESAVEKQSALKHGEAARWKAIREASFPLRYLSPLILTPECFGLCFVINFPPVYLQYAEKLILLTQASEVLIDECLPDSTGTPYTAKQRTAEVRSTLQQSLDQWHLNPAIATTSPFKPRTPSASTLDPRGFGETHRQELEHTPSVVERQKADQEALDAHHRTSTGAQHPSPTSGIGAANTGVNPAQLNTNPATLPLPASANIGAPHSPPTAGSPTIQSNAGNKKPGLGPAVAVGAGVAALSTSPSGGEVRPPAATDTTPASSNVTASIHPTVAETGVPITSASGPGPASGSLKSGTPTGPSPTWGDPAPTTAEGAKYETANEEKKRLEREDRERFLRFGTGLNKPGGSAAGTSTNTNVPAPAAAGVNTSTPVASGEPRPETAEEEKRRLEREERERVLRGESTSGGRGQGQPPRRDNLDDPNGDEQLPSYRP